MFFSFGAVFLREFVNGALLVSGWHGSIVGINGIPGISYVPDVGTVLYSDVLFFLKCW